MKRKMYCFEMMPEEFSALKAIVLVIALDPNLGEQVKIPAKHFLERVDVMDDEAAYRKEVRRKNR